MNSSPRKIEVSEIQLEDYLVLHPTQIKENVVCLERQLRTDSGPLDLLLLENNGMLWITELKITQDTQHLNQGLRYYDWVRTNIETISRAYSQEDHTVDVSKEPGLILVSPNFSPELVRIAKYVGIPILLMKYSSYEINQERILIFCEEVNYGNRYEPPVLPTKSRNLQYIESEIVRNLCSEIIEKLEGEGIVIRPIGDYTFSAWWESRRFMLIRCKKNFLSIQVEPAPGTFYDRKRIETQEEWEIVYADEVLPLLDFYRDLHRE